MNLTAIKNAKMANIPKYNHNWHFWNEKCNLATLIQRLVSFHPESHPGLPDFLST
jgi:hypothetical protein